MSIMAMTPSPRHQRQSTRMMSTWSGQLSSLHPRSICRIACDLLQRGPGEQESRVISMGDRRLFELVADDGTSISPFVWRIKYALGAKKLDYETCGVAFADIPHIEEGRFTTVPVLQDGELYVGDSWTIADYLDSVSSDPIRLFSSPAERTMVQFFDEWLGSSVRPLLFRICVKDIHDRLQARDQE